MSGAAAPGGALLVLDGALGDPVAGLARIESTAAPQVTDADVRSKGIMPQIATLLPEGERHHLVAVVLGTGPGSYSGIRTAAGAAASIAMALALPLLHLRSDQAIARAAGRTVDLALGAREILRIETSGARLLERNSGVATEPLDDAARAALAAPLLAALAEAGRAALHGGGAVWATVESIDPAQHPIELHYLARPRGVGDVPQQGG